MTELVTTHDDRPKRSNGAARNGAARVLVSARALAAHLSCVRSYIAKLVEQGVIERRADGPLRSGSMPREIHRASAHGA